MDYMVFMFAHQSTFLFNALAWDTPMVQNKIAQYTNQVCGAPIPDVLAALKSPVYNEMALVSTKYAAWRAVTGAPQYFVNGVLVPDASTFNNETDWQNLFNGFRPN